MTKQEIIKIGDSVCINNPSSPYHDKFGEYVGIADTYNGLQTKHRIRVDDETTIFYRNEFTVI